MAFGLTSALRRAFSAIQASCSRVMPYLSKCFCANIAIQIAAEGAENVRFHCMKPDALNPPPPPPPGMTADRPFSPCAEPSHTDRKHNTWVASPDAAARQALITEPSCPDVSRPLLYQPHSIRSASITS